MTTSDNTYVGRPIPRTEDPRLLRGKGCFLDDLHRPEMLYAVVLRSQVAHGMLRGIDPSEALALPGVHAILSAADIEGDLGRIPIRIAPLAGTDPYRQPVIASGKVRYVGEPIAIVVADTTSPHTIAPAAATSRRLSRRPPIPAAKASRCSVIRRCRWKCAASSPNGMLRADT